MRCGECGHPVGPSGDRFCGRCGASLDTAGHAAHRSRGPVGRGLFVGLVALLIGVAAAVWASDRSDPPDPPGAADVEEEVRLGAVVPWEFLAGGMHHRRIVGVASRGGEVYAADGAALYAIDATDGTIRWRYAGGEGIHAGPELTDDAVIATTRDGLVAVDADRGETIWRTRTGDARTWDHLATSTGLVAASGQRATTAGPVGTIGVFDAGSGEQRWAVDLDGWTTTPLALAEGVLVVATHQGGRDGRVEAFDVATGASSWQVPVTGAAQPVVHGETVYAATVREVVAVDPDDGSERWRTPIEPRTGEGEPSPQVTVVDGQLRVAFARTQPHVLTLDLADGEVRGHRTLSSLGGDGLATIGTRDDLDHVVGIAWDDLDDGTVRAVGADGETVWEQRLDQPVSPGLHLTSPPVAGAHARAWVGTRSGSLVALDLDDGSVGWRSALPPPVGWQRAATTDGHLVLVDVGSNLIALRGSDGDLRWTVEDMDAPGTRVFGPHGSVLVGSRLRRIIELDPASGDVAAEIEIEPRGAIRTLAASDRYVLAGTTSGVHGVDPVHRRQRWVLETDVPIEDVVGGRDHVAAVDEDGRLLLLDGSDGELRREVDVEACTPPVIVGDTVVVGTARGLRAFDTVEGTERWTVAASRPSCVPLALAGDLVHVTDLVRTVSALDPEDGSEVWATELDELVTTPPAAGPQHVAVGTASGTVLLDVADGSEAGVVTSPAHPVAVPVLLRDGLLTLGADGVVRVVPLD